MFEGLSQELGVDTKWKELRITNIYKKICKIKSKKILFNKIR